MPPIIGQHINSIEILNQLPVVGGTAEVYRGYDHMVGYFFAVKRLRKELFGNDLVKSLFIEEANQYLYLEHPNIVQLRDFIMRDDAYYLVMEFVEGKNLEQYMNSVTGAMMPEQAIPYMCAMLDAMSYAHGREVIHRDIKPSNIMITQNAQVKIIDFGIAVKKENLDTDIAMYTPMYASPEQVTEGAPIDHRSDIYSLGVTFFQMLTKRTPYPPNTPSEELKEMVKKEPLPPLKDCIPWATPSLQVVLDRATHKKASERYASCADFKKALETI